jgi:hypothetical protein
MSIPRSYGETKNRKMRVESERLDEEKKYFEEYNTLTHNREFSNKMTSSSFWIYIMCHDYKIKKDKNKGNNNGYYY